MSFTSFSKYVLLKPESSTSSFLAYKDASGTVALESEIGAFNRMAKIELDPSTTNSKYFHIRFSHNNKYWCRKDGFIVAVSTTAEEDITKESCTLFQANSTSGEGVFNLVHVPSGYFVEVGSKPESRAVVVKEATAANRLSFVNWQTIVKLPKNISFKSNNDKYLKAVKDSYSSLEFMSNDPNSDSSTYEIQPLPSGHIRIKSDYYKKFWKRANDGDQTVYAVASEQDTANKDTLFWPIKVDEKTIALRCEANNKYCSRNRYYYDYLHAAADAIVNEAKFEVKERVSSRKVYDVKYQLDEARIYNQEPFIAGSAMLTNKSSEKATLSSAITYEEEKTSTFTSTWSLTGGVKVSFEGNLTEVVKGKVEVSVSLKKEWSWSEETEIKKSNTVNASADVPANSSIKVSYVGTKGSYSVPFSYSQEDVDSATGEHIVTHHDDGIYYGSNYYNMDFEVGKAIPL